MRTLPFASSVLSASRNGPLSLAWQFAIAGVVVLILGMLVIGLWVTTNIERSFVQSRADSTALFVDSIISPLAQELSTASKLTNDNEKALLDAINDGPLAARVFSFKIWTRDATVAFSSDPLLIGRRFELRSPLRVALSGDVSSEFDPLEGEEHLVEKESGYAFLEVYSPIRNSRTGEIIGAAEFYEPASVFLSDLNKLRMFSWLVVASVTAGMLALLFVIVARGSAEIERQRKKLNDQVSELSLLLQSNSLLRERVDQAAHQTVTLNERYLRRISSDLHDGPTQLLSFVVMRLEAIRKGKGRGDDEMLVMRSVTDAIGEIRAICRGLQLPELEHLSVKEVALRAVQAHELYSGAKIHTDIRDVEAKSHGAKICVYRFLQEVLSNASRHSAATQISVSVRMDENSMVVQVEDNGVGFTQNSHSEGLGLAGLRERAASLGGNLEIHSSPVNGTVVRMTLP